MSLPTFVDIVRAKKLTPEQREADFRKLQLWSGTENGVKLIGNPYIQSYMTEHMGKTHYEGKPSLQEVMDDEKLRQDLYNRTITKERLEFNMPQAFSRRNPVCFLKPSVAKYLYTLFGATKVLDFTAGWGGRMMGAFACGIDYIGIDTNTELQPAYVEMIAEMSSWSNGTAQMLWQDCLSVDFSTLDYDFVFTSPPYYNKEVYEHMTPFTSKKQFYIDFLIPMLEKSLRHIKKNGWVCINVNPEYYEELTQIGFRKADRIETFVQSTSKLKDGSSKLEYVYCWKNASSSEDPTPLRPAPLSLASCATPSCTRCRELEQEVARLKAAMKLLLNV